MHLGSVYNQPDQNTSPWLICIPPNPNVSDAVDHIADIILEIYGTPYDSKVFRPMAMGFGRLH